MDASTDQREAVATITARACVMCGSVRLRPLYRGIRDHTGQASGTWSFLECEACRSATLDAWPPSESLASLYPRQYTFKASMPGRALLPRLLAALEWRAFYQSIYRARLAAFRRLTALNTGRVLEVGCGSGLFLQHLATRGYVVAGLELSPEDVAHAQALGLDVRAGTLDEAAGDERHDAVFLFSVLEHLPDPAAAVRQAHDVLRPGGWIAVEVPLIESLQSTVFGRRWHAVTEAPRHLSLPSADGVRRLLASAGFGEIRSAPGPLVDCAGIVALSLLPAAASGRAYGGRGTLGTLLRRCAGATLVPAGLLFALAERAVSAGTRAGNTIFCARKPA